MRYGLVSDIHGNFEAFSKALSLIEKAQVDNILGAGDIVGYGPDPSQCIHLVKEYEIKSVLGNHDCAVNNDEEASLFNTYAREAIEWERNNLSYEDLNFLKNLPLTLKENGFIIFHGLLDSVSPFTYILSDYEAWRSFNNMNVNIGFFGHTHIPGAYIMDEKGTIKFISGVKGLRIILEEGKRYLINVGSVGQPRDGNPQGAYTIFDSEKNTVEIHRFFYDIEKTYKKIISAGLPPFLGERLFIGF
jgi:predicted phosphodiesterase